VVNGTVGGHDGSRGGSVGPETLFPLRPCAPAPLR
jgi:hypothetical protein